MIAIGRGRTAGHRHIDRDHVGHAPAARIALAEDAAGAAAVAHRHHQLGLGGGIVGTPSAVSMWRDTGPVTSSMSAWRGLATNRMPSPSRL